MLTYNVLTTESQDLNTIELNTTEELCSSELAEDKICSCIAAGGCEQQGSSTCRITFCDGTTVNEGPNRTLSDGSVVINQPCPSKDEEFDDGF